VSSSKTVVDDDDDPPCIRAKREYLDILDDVNDEFRCVADGSGVKPLTIEVSSSGAKVKRTAFATALGVGTASEASRSRTVGRVKRTVDCGDELHRDRSRAPVDPGARRGGEGHAAAEADRW
jgi:hypothetical protein